MTALEQMVELYRTMVEGTDALLVFGDQLDSLGEQALDAMSAHAEDLGLYK